MFSVRGFAARAAGVAALLLFSSISYADPASGLQWLNTQNQPNGSIASAGDLAEPSQSTAETLRAFYELGSVSPSVAAASQYLSAQSAGTTEALCRLTINKIINGENAAATVIALLLNQDSLTGGFSAAIGFEPSIIDTVFALDALAISGNLSQPAASKAFAYLQARQNADGGWSDNGNESSVYLTALALSVAQKYSGSRNVTALTSAASGFLLARKNDSGLWDEDFLSAHSIIALAQTLPDRSPIAASVAALRDRQQANGSWDDDVYTTAVVLRALATSQGSGQSVGSGAVSGIVTLAGTTQPVAGVSIAVLNLAGVHAQTNVDGFFSFTGVSGDRTLVASKAGYTSASTTIHVIPGIETTATGLMLAPLAGKGQISMRVVDAQSGTPVTSASVALNGGSAVLTNDRGEATFDAVPAGSYSLVTTKSGYTTTSTAGTIGSAESAVVTQALVRTTASPSGPTSASLGVVDAATGSPIVGALLSLPGDSFTAGNDGVLHLSFAAPGTYVATISSPAYASQTHTFTIAAGASNLGQIRLWKPSASQAPTTLALEGLVVDGLTGQPISGALVVIHGGSESAVSDGSGRFAISGISQATFSVDVQAAGYSQKSYAFADVAFGRLFTTLRLSPPSNGGTAVTLNGRVVDAASGQPVPAVIRIEGTNLTAEVDGAGNYSILDVSRTSFDVSFAALGYKAKTVHSELEGPGTYTLNAQLEPTPDAGLQIYSFSPKGSGGGANVVQEFLAVAGNSSTETLSGGLIAYIIDAQGKRWAKIVPTDIQSGQPAPSWGFSAGESRQFLIRWNPTQMPAGSYNVVFDVVAPNSISYEHPYGTIVAEASTYATVDVTRSFVGSVALEPPVAQAGSTAPVALRVLVVNSGNTELNGQALTMTIRDGSNVVHTASGTLPRLAIGEFEYVSFGDWVPVSNANFDVEVAAQQPGMTGLIAGKFYVGDKPDAQFVVTPTAVGTGNQIVHGSIQVNGRDTRLGVSDPFAFALRSATVRGLSYVQQGAVTDMEANNCLRCHIESQAYYGMMSTLGREYGPDEETMKMIENAFITMQRTNGSIFHQISSSPRLQSALAAWSLSESPRKTHMFELKYDVAKYLLAGVNDIGNGFSNFTLDATASWFDGADAGTMMVVKALSDVVQTQQKNSIVEIQSQGWGAKIPLGLAPSDIIKKDAAGRLYVTSATTGTIERLDIQTGTRTPVLTFTPTNSDSIISMTIRSEDEIYFVTSSNIFNINWIYRIRDQGQPVLMGAESPGDAVDIEVGPDNMLYLAHQGGQKITRMSRDLPPYVMGSGTSSTTFMSGGLLTGPNSIRFAPNGDMYIASAIQYLGSLTRPAVVKVTSLDPSTAVRVGKMLNWGPTQIDLDSDGNIYYFHPEPSAEPGITRIAPDGRPAQFGAAGMNGLVLADGVVYSRYTDGSLAPLVAQTEQVDQIPAMKTAVLKLVRYIASINEYDTLLNISEGSKLLTLSYGKTVIDDPALISQIDAKMQQIEARLRSRQKVDGGWKKNENVDTPSDPMVTAVVGLALDSLNPPATDPALINALQYLINAQQPDGSWQSEIDSDVMAASSLVTAFLPRLMDRYIGIDVELHIGSPVSTSFSATSPAPDAVTTMTDGSIDHVFRMPALTSSGRSIGFDLGLAGMQHGESRPAVSYAYALSTSSYDGSQVRVDIPVPNVVSASGLALASAATDKPEYLPTETAQLSAVVANGGSLPASGSVSFSVYSAADDGLVTQLPAVSVSNVSNSGATASTQWPIAQLIAGSYYTTATLLDVQGTVVSTRRADFQVLPSSVAAAYVRVSTDQQSYNTTDQVRIDDLVKNLASNAPIVGATRQLQLLSPTSQVLFNQVIDVAELPSNGVIQKSAQYLLQSATEGSYTVKATLRSASGSVLAEHSAAFTVAEVLDRAAIGQVQAGAARVFEGEPQTCTHTIKNGGTLPFTNTQVQTLLVRLDTESLIDTTPITVNLVPGQQTQSVRGIQAAAPSGIYACVLQVFSNNEWKTIGSAQYAVVPVTSHVQVSVTPSPTISDISGSVQLAATVANLAQDHGEHGDVLQLRVISPAGGSAFQQDFSLPGIAAAAQLDRNATYSFSDAAEGIYSVHAYVLNRFGDVIASADSQFELRKSLSRAISGSVSVQQPTLNVGDSQTCTDTVSNSSINALSGVQIRQVLERTDVPQTISTTPSTINVQANGHSDQIRVFSTGSMAAGSYACRLDAYVDNQWRTLASRPFTLTAPPLVVNQALTRGDKGRLLVLMDGPQSAPSDRGLCHNGVLDVLFEADFDPPLSPDTVVQVRLQNRLGLTVDTETGKPGTFVTTINNNLVGNGPDISISDLGVGHVVIELAGTTAGSLLGSNYQIVVTTTQGLLQKTSVSTGLIDLACNATVAVGDVLNNALTVIGFGSNPPADVSRKGIGDGPDLRSPQQQKDRLEVLLKQEGWTYTIAQSAQAFADAFHSGGYSHYALLSEYEVLSEYTQKELREAVYSGAGLLVAGRHDVRSRILDEPLGLEYKGAHQHATQVKLLMSDIFTPADLNLGEGDVVQRVHLHGADRLGYVVNGGTHDSSVSRMSYGQGRAMLVSFDLMAEITVNGLANALANALVKPITWIHPAQMGTEAGRTVPIRLTIANQAIAGNVTVSVTPSLGGTLLQASAGSIAGNVLTWTTSLNAGESKTLDLWVKLPLAGTPVTVTANLHATSGGFSYDAPAATLQLSPTVPPGLTSAIADLTAYVQAQPNGGFLVDLLGQLLNIKTPAKRALEYLQAANQALTGGNLESTRANLLAATDQLKQDSNAAIKPIRIKVDRAVLEVQQLLY